ncbi:Alpha/Beta hydrolase protein [Ilyonectria sp. MPI-CAGE-AT-0026]|nr:Alpha/Beta hydrolase protein [Ilyonectria sp. MPI-CAGE-AT-0026]
MASNSSPNLFSLSDTRTIAYELSTASNNGRTGPTIVLANSICAPYRTWDRVVPALLAKGFNVLRYDQPGHGESSAHLEDVTRTNFSTLADDAVSLLQHLGIFRLAAWIGVSMGAVTGAYVAAAKPGLIERLVICDTLNCSPGNAGVQDTLTPRAEAVRLDESKLSEITNGMANKWFSPGWKDNNPSEFDAIRAAMMTTTPLGFRACVNALTAPSFNLLHLAATLGDSVESVTLLVGELDGDLPRSMKALHEAIQTGFDKAGNRALVYFHMVPDAGHLFYIDSLPAFLNIVCAAVEI